MMKIFSSFKSKDLYLFVVFALIEEASFYNKPVTLPKNNNPDEGFDLLFPNGLPLFNHYNRPIYVYIRNSSTRKNYRYFRNDVTSGFSVVILLDDYGKSRMVDGVTFFGRDFVASLIDDHGTAFISFVLSNKKSQLETIERKINEKPLENRISEEKLVFKIKNVDSNITINDDLLRKLSNLNSQILKASLSTDCTKNSVALILGNGISIPFGADSWSEMIDNLINYLKPYHIDDCARVKKYLSESSYSVSSFVKAAFTRDRMDSKFYDALFYCIYRKYNELMHGENSMIKAIALAKKKYKDLPIFTYNYDTFVERQYYYETKQPLNYYSGFNYKNNLLDSVVHLHGYYSYKRRKHKDIILTDKEYFDNYLSSPMSWSKDAQLFALDNYKCLFIGSSMSDLFQMSIIQNMKNQDKKGKWYCFALMNFEGLSLNERIQVTKYYAEKGILLITTDSFKDMPNKLAELIGISF